MFAGARAAPSPDCYIVDEADCCVAIGRRIAHGELVAVVLEAGISAVGVESAIRACLGERCAAKPPAIANPISIPPIARR